MKIKSIALSLSTLYLSSFVAMLITWTLAGTACASVSHSHDRGTQSHDSHDQKESEREHDSHKMKGAEHDNTHQHDHEGSTVGQPAPSARATKIIRVTTMDTVRFEFSSELDLKDGDIIKFVVTNQGKISHEFSIGDAMEQQAHRDIMAKMPNMTHEDGNTITVKPGETKELTWQFKGGEEVVFACNIPGHFEAGMFEKVSISASHNHH